LASKDHLGGLEGVLEVHVPMADEAHITREGVAAFYDVLSARGHDVNG
jgi:hypothetical protein